MYKILIVEDEPIIADDLSISLEQVGYNVIGIASSANEALQMLESENADLALLDINIKGKDDGVSLAKRLKEIYDLPFIFITSYFDDATLLRVESAKPAAYIMKPFKEEEVLMNVKLALNKLNKQNVSLGAKSKLFVRDSGILKPIKLEELIFAKGESNYTILMLENDKKYTLSHTLKSVNEKLPKEIFCRVHKSYIININYIDLIEHSIVKIAGQSIPIGKAFRGNLFEMMEIL